jgi:hypothetical protein
MVGLLRCGDQADGLVGISASRRIRSANGT